MCPFDVPTVTGARQSRLMLSEPPEVGSARDFAQEIDFLRRQGRLSFADIEGLPEPLATEPEDSPEYLLLRAEHAAYLHDGLMVLSERERTALVLRDVDGLSSREVAEILKCSEATVRSHIANGRIKFRRYLEERKA